MLYSLVAGVQKYDPPLTESHNEEKRNIMHINATQLTLIAHFDSKKKMVSDKMQTAFKKALVPEVNCYFCHLPLFSFYLIKGVILRLVLKSCLRHLWFWLMYSITREKNNYSFLRNFHVRYARRDLSASRACLSPSPSQSSQCLFINCVSVAPTMISRSERNVLICLIWSCLKNTTYFETNKGGNFL